METAKLILDYLKTLIWPIILVGIIIKFRTPITNLLSKITKAELLGFKAEFEKEIKEQIQKKAEEIRIEIINKDEEIKSDINSIEEEVKETNKRILENSSFAAVFDDGSSTMLTFAVKDSIQNNIKYSIYYDPAERNHNTPFKYIGLYNNMEIVAIGKVEKIVFCDYDSEKQQLVSPSGKNLNINEDEYNRIKETILNTDYYDLEEGNKFFLVDNFYETHFKKSSDYALRAKKYFWLDEMEGFKKDMTTEQIAKFLDGKIWE
ncbi:MAG: hypothetical protein ACXVPU_16610 [Bacteroidia bacterium]